jgi:hypothetical protein
MPSRIAITLLAWSVLTMAARAQVFYAPHAFELASKQTLPSVARQIEYNTDVKVGIEIDAASFGADEKAWGNLAIIANRIAGAFNDVGRDQAGKDALDRDVQRVMIVKLPPGQQDAVELQLHTLYVRTSGSDRAMVVLQNIIIAGLEAALHTGHPPPTP